mgnify:FL=1
MKQGFEQVDKRFEQIDQRFEKLTNGSVYDLELWAHCVHGWNRDCCSQVYLKGKDIPIGIASEGKRYNFYVRDCNQMNGIKIKSISLLEKNNLG